MFALHDLMNALRVLERGARAMAGDTAADPLERRYQNGMANGLAIALANLDDWRRARKPALLNPPPTEEALAALSYRYEAS